MHYLQETVLLAQRVRKVLWVSMVRLDRKAHKEPLVLRGKVFRGLPDQPVRRELQVLTARMVLMALLVQQDRKEMLDLLALKAYKELQVILDRLALQDLMVQRVRKVQLELLEQQVPKAYQELRVQLVPLVSVLQALQAFKVRPVRKD
jgi:hypothetical protein